MSDVTPDIQRQVIQAISTEHGLTADSLQQQWTQWAAGPQKNATAGASAADVKRWFVDRLSGLGLIASPLKDRSSAGKTRRTASATTATTAKRIDDADDDDYDDDRASFDTQDQWYADLVGGAEDEGQEAVGLDQDLQEVIRREVQAHKRQQQQKTSGNKLATTSATKSRGEFSDRVFSRAQERVMAARGKVGHSTTTASGTSSKLVLTQAMIEDAERRVFADMMAEAKAGALVGGQAPDDRDDADYGDDAEEAQLTTLNSEGHLYGADDDYDDCGDDDGYDDEYDDDYADDDDDYADDLGDSPIPFTGQEMGQDKDAEALEPIGRRRAVGRRRIREQMRRYSGSKAIAAWALRHDDSDDQAAIDSGMTLGNALANAVVKLDRKGRQRKKFPLKPVDISARHDAILQTLIEGIDAAGRTSEPSREYAEDVMRNFEQDINQYSTAIAGVLSSGAPLPSGGLWDRLGSLGRGTRSKVRVLLNERDLRLMTSAIINLANTAVAQPGEVRSVPGYGRDADVQRRIRAFGRGLVMQLTKPAPGTRRRIGFNDGASRAAINLFYGAGFAFMTHPQLYPHAPHLVQTGLTKLRQEQYLLAKEPHEIATDQEIQQATPPALPAQGKVSEAAKRFANDLVSRALGYLKRHPEQQQRAGVRFGVMVPADPQCMAKVRSQLASDPDRYLQGALLARHPNRELDAKSHMLSLSGTVFHLSRPKAGDRLVNSPGTLRQMRRKNAPSGLTADERWNREVEHRSSSALEPHPKRLPMDFRGSAAHVDSKQPIKVHPIYYWPRS